MAKKDRRTKAELLADLNRAERSANERIEMLKHDRKSLQDENAQLKGVLDTSQLALGGLDSDNRKLRKQLETIESEYQREAETEEARVEGRLEGQCEAFLLTIQLILSQKAGSVAGIDLRELI